LLLLSFASFKVRVKTALQQYCYYVAISYSYTSAIKNENNKSLLIQLVMLKTISLTIYIYDFES